jgi:hypothetical protein
MLDDDFRQPVRIIQHLIIPEPQHAKPLIFKPSLTDLVGFAGRVLAAIDFNDELLCKADEIDDVSPDWLLAFEFESCEAMGA